jgi:hypothetical protein
VNITGAASVSQDVRIIPRMSADLAKKTCKMCCMDIPKDARKCPHCHHFQNRLSMVLFYPGFVVLVLLIPLVVLPVFFETTMFDRGEDYQRYKDQIEITNSEIAFGDTKSAGTVAVIGTIKNTSPIPWKEIQVHADFFDAQGKRTDVGEREDYSFYLPANGTSTFKASFRREFPETNYVKHSVRVVAAKDARARW